MINEANFKKTHNGKQTGLYTLKNKNGLIAQITNYGAIIVSIIVPDRNGNMADIVQGYDTIDEYINGNGPYQGAVVGRVANRIGKGSFILNKKEYKLAINNGPNHLHGGITGFSKVVWDVINTTSASVELKYTSVNGEEGYPGTLTVGLTYNLTDENELQLDYIAITEKTTIVNLASHSYFNLAGEGSGDAMDHDLQIKGRFYTPTDDTNIPTGEIVAVKGTPMDFTVAKKIGRDINVNFEQLKFGNGYDHNWVLEHPVNELGLAAIAHDAKSGRVMEVFTTQPGVQLYTANWMDNEPGKGGKKYQKRWSFCLETQHFADAINKPHFPSITLNPGEEYRHSCVHRFSVK
jgi:aldose 1-epimerase